MNNKIEDEIEEIFKEIDKAINYNLIKALCKNFIEKYEFIKRNHLKGVNKNE